MSPRKLKAGYFVLEGLNSFATTYYFYYLFFFMASAHGFGNRENLAVAALNGLVYTLGVWLAGRFGDKLGYRNALKLGFLIMAGALATGAFVSSARAHIGVMVACTGGMCLTWPNLEALCSENETPYGLQQMVGIYNIVWAGAGGLAFFTGGALLEHLGLRSMFWFPAGVCLVQFGIVVWLERQPVVPEGTAASTGASLATCLTLNPRPIARAKAFLRMAWLANPFSYVAVNTVVAVVPGLARDLGFSPTVAGFFCSIWLFARLAAFWWLWLWPGWHYRFRWFITAYLLLTAGFGTILLASHPWVIALAQVLFGVGQGLIYSSSLYYSMDVGGAKSEHGGLHEAAIGAGLCGGPAVGAAALHFFPGQPKAGVIAVSGLLVIGLLGVLAVRQRSRMA